MAPKKSASSAPVKRAKKKRSSTKAKAKKEKINFSDIPELSDAQLKSMRRVGRPPMGEQARQLIAIRVDPMILHQLQIEADQLGKGYQTLINDILAEHVKTAS